MSLRWQTRQQVLALSPVFGSVFLAAQRAVLDEWPAEWDEEGDTRTAAVAAPRFAGQRVLRLASTTTRSDRYCQGLARALPRLMLAGHACTCWRCGARAAGMRKSAGRSTRRWRGHAKAGALRACRAASMAAWCSALATARGSCRPGSGRRAATPPRTICVWAPATRPSSESCANTAICTWTFSTPA